MNLRRRGVSSVFGLGAACAMLAGCLVRVIPVAQGDAAASDATPDATPAPIQALEQDAGSEGGKKGGGGCESAPGGAPALSRMAWLVAGLGLVWLRLRRRSPRR